ncbi:MAG: hypothetical protein J7L22_05630 [Candidatus Marinimicrobia bacterium]|nr:hypothetical protein [Candidatus Neomarinimicrobiota bacterium]
MRITNKQVINLSLGILVLVLCSCTNNPLFQDNVVKSEKIKGTVSLSDGSSPNDIYVWLQSYNLGTRTDEDGNFSITLPNPSVSGMESSYTGSVNLFFYEANYWIDSVEIIFSDGKLLDDQDAVDRDGVLKNTVTLTKYVDVDVSIFGLEDLPNKFHTFINTTALKTNVIINSLRQYREWPEIGFDRTGLIIQSLDNTDSEPVFIDLPKSELGIDVVITGVGLSWGFEIDTDDLGLDAGNYRIIPYMLFPQRGLPVGLLESISEAVLNFDEDYLLYPVKRNGGEFVVQ